MLDVRVYRAAFVIRLVGLASSVVAAVFFARFVGAVANPHMAAYGAKTKELLASRVIHILSPA